MFTKDVKKYLIDKYSNYYTSISELSKSDSGKILVNDDRKMYNFDYITRDIYRSNVPESADAIMATDKEVILVEYKSGFKKRVKRSDLENGAMTCYDDENKYCIDYTELFFRNQKNEEKILKHSIQFKAIESYMTFTHEIVPNIAEDDVHRRKSLVYCVVVDDYVESMEGILNDLSKKESDNNQMQSIRQSLSRFSKRENKAYYYDEIKVFSPYEFRKYLDQKQ